MPSESPRTPRPWFRIEPRAAAESAPTSADVYVYGDIGESWWGGGISPSSVVDQIAALDVESLTVHINSPGGAAWDGITIMNALRAHPAKVDVIVDGLAASAASVIAMAGDTVTMNRGSQMMIHDASGGAWGNASTMEETAGILHKLSDSIADVYAARAGGGRTKWRDAMQAESWYTAEEAVTAGLADSWDGTSEPAAADATASFDLSRFRFPGRAHAPAPRSAANKLPSSTEPGDPIRKENVVAYDDLKAGLATRLGVTDAEASDETLLAALDEALEEGESETEETAAAATLPAGAIVVDQAAHEQLQRDAARGRQAMDTIDSQRRDGMVSAALAEGRIAASAAESWRAQLDKDETGISALLSTFPKNAVPVDEVGHSDTVTSADDSLYAQAWGTDKEA